MKTKFDKAVGLVKNYLEINSYSYSIKMNHMRCFRLFGDYLADEKKPYSKSLAKQWLQSIKLELCYSSYKTYRLALDRFDVAYQGKKIVNTKAIKETSDKYKRLEPCFKEVLDIFLDGLSEKYDYPYLQTIKFSIARFLDYLTKNGVFGLEDITHQIIYDFYKDYKHESYKMKDVHNNCIRKFLQYLSERKIIQASIPLALDKYVLSRLVFIDSLTIEIRNGFSSITQGISMNAEEYYQKAIELSALIEHHKYSRTMRKVFRKTWKEFFVFLESNALNYSHENALAWANLMSQYTVQWKSFRRAIMLFEQYRNHGQINPQIVYSYQLDRADNLPEWCKADYDCFIQLKRKGGAAESTLDMYRSSCLRFIEYLIATGINSWEAVTPEIIKEFHHQDPHSTSEAKNAYSSRIRIFLEHLGENGYVSPTLFMAVPSEYAPHVSIIQTLKDKDIEDIYRLKDDANDAMELRDVAMILLGLRMGLRASDITNIKFSDISWEFKTISVQQQKTDRFLKLPMPVEVGNALYCYIVQGRPESSSTYVFISHRVPYSRLCRGACLRALAKALPEISQGFHVTRKTFASRMLVNNVATGRIAESLGHADNSSVMQYLSTDNEKMRMCALSLSEVPVKGVVI